jgi:type VI protein secretion system component VasF
MAHTPPHNDSPISALLSALTDALLDDRGSLDQIISRYNVPRRDAESMVGLIRKLSVVLVRVRPSRRFVQQLKLELTGVSQHGVFQRVRFLPPRVQIAAGVALLAGFMLLSRRRLRLSDSTAQEVEVGAV